MASYTDSVPQFKPYVQQLPVQAMVEVGMQKQHQYDEGYQRIQSQIDKVAGLSVMRDVDKQYLQSKMNELGNNLRMVSMGDFSNYQLVNSVGGMVNQVGKDEKIQNSVMSTANIQKQRKAMEDAKKSGEWGPENEYDYQKKQSAYMNSTKVGELFTDQYTPYTDVNKKLYAVGKEVGLDEKTIQELFQTKADGSWELDADGKPKINYVMAEKHLKGKDPAKILAAFQNALTPQDYNQLAITGRYVKGSSSPDNLKKEISTNYSSNILSIDSKIDEIKIKLTDATSQNKRNEPLIESLNNQISQLTGIRTKLVSSRDADIAQVDTNPDAVRASLYTNNYLAGMAKSLGSLTEETTYKVNPHFTVMMELNKFKFDQEKFRVGNEHWLYEQQQKALKDEDEALRWKLEMKWKYGMGDDGSSGTKQPITIEGQSFAISNAPQEEYNAELADLNTINYDLALKYNKSLTPDWTDAQVDQAMRRNAEKKGIPFNDYITEFSSKQLTTWKTDPKGVPDEVRGLIIDQSRLTKSLIIKKKQIEETDRQARQNLAEQGKGLPTQQEIDKNVRESSVVVGDQTIKLSKSDVVDWAQVHPEVFDPYFPYRIDPITDNTRQTSEKRLVAKYGLPTFLEMEKKLFNYDRSSRVDRMSFHLPGNKITFNKEIEQAGSYLQNINYNDLQEEKAKIYVEKGFISQGLSHPLVRGDEKEDDFRRRLSDIVLSHKDSKDIDKISELVSSQKVDGFRVIETPGVGFGRPTSYAFEVKDESGKPYTLDITPEDFTALSKRSPATNLQIPDVLQQVQLFGNSGLKGVGDGSDAYFTMNDFTKLKGTDYKVNADLIKDGRDPDKLWFRIWKYEKGSTKPKKLTLHGTGTGFNPDGSVAMYINGSYNPYLDYLPLGINDEVIKKMENED